MEASKLVIQPASSVSRADPYAASRGAAARVVAVIGALLAVVGWIDWGLLFVPARFGSADWEFGTIAASFDALPLATLGTAAFVAVAIAANWRRTAAGLGVFAILVALTFIGLSIFYLLDVPVVLQGITAEIRPIALKAIAKTSAFAIVYIVTYIWLGLACWRTLRTIR